MRCLILAFVVAAVLSVAALGLVSAAGSALAAGPSDGTGPWIADGGSCPSGYHAMLNTASGKGHCFKD